jgi:putative glutathione S-transferase
MNEGEFQRTTTTFRNWITPEGHAGPTGKGGFPAASGRYRLYVSLACPWAHRTLIFRALKDLEKHIAVTVVDPLMLENGWELKDPSEPLEFLYQLYLAADANYEGRVTVPVLWDSEGHTIVSNESADIIRMFNSAFNHLTENTLDFYPASLRERIDAFNDHIYSTINNGVYRAGFATSQHAYKKAFESLFESLDWLDNHLAHHRYLLGTELTEADWRLFTTLVRFDAVYFGHFKCNLRQLRDYSSLSGYLRDLYQYPGIAQTVDFAHIKQHYYGSHPTINPTGIVPLGPELDLHAPHGRDQLGSGM